MEGLIHIGYLESERIRIFQFGAGNANKDYHALLICASLNVPAYGGCPHYDRVFLAEFNLDQKAMWQSSSP